MQLSGSRLAIVCAKFALLPIIAGPTLRRETKFLPSPVMSHDTINEGEDFCMPTPTGVPQSSISNAEVCFGTKFLAVQLLPILVEIWQLPN